MVKEEKLDKLEKRIDQQEQHQKSKIKIHTICQLKRSKDIKRLRLSRIQIDHTDLESMIKPMEDPHKQSFSLLHITKSKVFCNKKRLKGKNISRMENLMKKNN